MAGARQPLLVAGVCLKLDHEILERCRVSGKWKKFESRNKQMIAAVNRCDPRDAEQLDMSFAVHVDSENADLADGKSLAGFEPAARSAELGDADSLASCERRASG
jgi:hypothetical protein